VKPALDPAFRPAVLATRAYRDMVDSTPGGVPVRIALEQADGSIFRFDTRVLPASHPRSAANAPYLERFVKFILWSRGGWRIHVDGPQELAGALTAHYRDTETGRFDSHLVGERMFDHPLAVVHTSELPPEHSETRPLGRHLDGCRIGFDLGGSDRKAAAVVEGRVVFSDETVWDPYHKPDPQYHYDGIMDSLTKAAAHLPRVDAIGGSAAGVYVNNRVKAGSLFRGVPQDLFDARVKDMFLEIRQAWNDVPFEVVNDGEVTALAGSMSLGVNAILGIALGTSTAAGYVTADGNITSWLNELAFVPVDYNPGAPVDEWSGDFGVGSQYFSQQCVGRLLPAAGIEAPPGMGLPERLKLVQSLMAAGDPRAARIYRTIGTYLGYGVAHCADFYDLRHVLVLGRVTSGSGGDLIVSGAREVLAAEFPELAARIQFHVPDEHEKRHGQAIAAASLPAIEGAR
jgi:predicted NBD/HSP70 family sugar kinase